MVSGNRVMSYRAYVVSSMLYQTLVMRCSWAAAMPSSCRRYTLDTVGADCTAESFIGKGFARRE